MSFGFFHYNVAAPVFIQSNTHENSVDRHLLSSIEFTNLKADDEIDYRDDDGRFVRATVRFDHPTGQMTVKSHSLGETIADTSNLSRFARSNTISRLAYRQEIRVGEFVDFNPQPHPGWRTGRIKVIDPRSAQVQVEYKDDGLTLSYWTHALNSNEIAKYLSKSCELLLDQRISRELWWAVKTQNCTQFAETVCWNRLQKVILAIRVNPVECGDPRKYLDLDGEISFLCYAAFVGALEIVQYLHEEFNADVNDASSPTKSAPLILAAKRGHAGVVKYLVRSCGCDISTTDKLGRDALRAMQETDCWRATTQNAREKIIRYLSPRSSSTAHDHGLWKRFRPTFWRQPQTQIQQQTLVSQEAQRQHLFLTSVRQMTEVKQRYIEAIVQEPSPDMLHVHNLCLQGGLGNIRVAADDFKEGSETLKAAMTIVTTSQNASQAYLNGMTSDRANDARKIECEVSNFLYRVFQHEEVRELKCIVSNPNDETVGRSMGKIMAGRHAVEKDIQYCQENEDQLQRKYQELAVGAVSRVDTRPVNDQLLYRHVRDGAQMKHPGNPRVALEVAQRLHMHEQEKRRLCVDEVIDQMEVDESGVPFLD